MALQFRSLICCNLLIDDNREYLKYFICLENIILIIKDLNEKHRNGVFVISLSVASLQILIFLNSKTYEYHSSIYKEN